MSHDLVIRGGTVVDGTGAPARTADVAVTDGVVTEGGRIDRAAGRVVDADGALVTPGFVDIHTHYDGQATWDEHLVPSSWHGVTTVVMGNCGVGFAPCRPDDHDRIIELMEGVEDIPGTALHEGIPWAWESFGEYLDHLSTRSVDVDVGTQVPHGATRLYVMGERGARGDAASGEEIAAMGEVAAEAIAAGALGFTTSRTTNHKTSRGEPTPTLPSSGDELVGIARAIGGTGVLQVGQPRRHARAGRGEGRALHRPRLHRLLPVVATTPTPRPSGSSRRWPTASADPAAMSPAPVNGRNC